MLVKTVLKRNKDCNLVKIYQQQKLNCGTIKALVSVLPGNALGNMYYSDSKVLAYGYDPIDKVLEIWIK